MKEIVGTAFLYMTVFMFGAACMRVSLLGNFGAYGQALFYGALSAWFIYTMHRPQEAKARDWARLKQLLQQKDSGA